MSYFKPGYYSLTQLSNSGGTITTVNQTFSFPGSVVNRAVRLVNPAATYSLYANAGNSGCTATVTDFQILPNDIGILPAPHNATVLALYAAGTITGVTWTFGTIEP